MNKEIIHMLEEKARNIRCSIIEMLGEAGSGHPGGSLSAADILSVLYFYEMRIDSKNPNWEDRDKFVLSKGHAAPALYATLAEKGYFPKEELMTLRKIGSNLQGHPDMNKVSGVEMSTGSLGQGLAAANGMALAAKLDKKGSNIFVLLGDGEIQEGMIWESAMAAAHYKLDNIIAFIDYNGLQIDGSTKDVMNVNPVGEKFKAFGWQVITIDGHNIKEIIEALQTVKEIIDKPAIIIAKTIKGKGVSFMENEVGWHGTAPNKDQVEQALKEIRSSKEGNNE